MAGIYSTPFQKSCKPEIGIIEALQRHLRNNIGKNNF
jgi:hypothetical protein